MVAFSGATLMVHGQVWSMCSSFMGVAISVIVIESMTLRALVSHKAMKAMNAKIHFWETPPPAKKKDIDILMS